MNTASGPTLPLRPWLRATDPSLPMLATRAAVELDAQRRGVSCDMGSVKQLSDLLKNSLNQGAESLRSSALLDPSTTVVVGRALASIPRRSTAKIAEVETLIKEVATWLERAARGQDIGHVDMLRDFCLALARGTSSHLRNFQDERPVHPHRR